jgi:hypothetical protein
VIFRDVPTSRFTAAPSAGWEILKKHGIDLAPRRGRPTWAVFLRSQAEALIACDFFTVEPLDGTKAYVMAMIEYATAASTSAAPPPNPRTRGLPSRPETSSWTSAGAPAQIKFLIRGPRHPLPAFVRCAPGRRRYQHHAQRRANAAHEPWNAGSAGAAANYSTARTLIWNLPYLRCILRELRNPPQHRPTAH